MPSPAPIGVRLTPAQDLLPGVGFDFDPAAHVLAECQDIIIGQGVVHELALTPTAHERRVVQHLQVLGEGTLQQAGRLDELADRPLAGLELVKDG